MPNKYLRHFLTHVIFQANYNIPALKTGLNPDLIALCSQVSGENIKEVKNSNVSINFLPNSPATTELNSRWVFEGAEISITIQHDFIQIVNLKYSNYANFHPIIESIFKLFKDFYDPFFSRVALRYVNNISFEDGNTFDFAGLIDQDLFNGLVKFKEKGLQRSIAQMIMKNDTDDLTTMFTYGFNNSLFPNKIIKREFLLDYDCFIIYNNPNDKIISISDLLLKIRNQVNELFESSILDKLRYKMNEHEKATI